MRGSHGTRVKNKEEKWEKERCPCRLCAVAVSSVFRPFVAKESLFFPSLEFNLKMGYSKKDRQVKNGCREQWLALVHVNRAVAVIYLTQCWGASAALCFTMSLLTCLGSTTSYGASTVSGRNLRCHWWCHGSAICHVYIKRHMESMCVKDSLAVAKRKWIG